MKLIILDTNALMAIAEFTLDIFVELEKSCNFSYKVYVLEGTIKELDKIIKEQRGKYKQAAKLALSLLKAKNIPVIKKKGDVDDLLVEYSKQEALVLTQDIALKRRLKKPYLTIRQKKRIVVLT